MSADAFQSENVRQLVERWVEGVTQVLESMTDHRPEAHWEVATGSLSETAGGQDLLWWEQPFPAAAGSIVWIAAERAAWEYAGNLTLRAAGLETVETQEAKNTWIEILGQSLAGTARFISGILGREVTNGTGIEHAPDPWPQAWGSVSLTYADGSTPPPLLVALSPQLVSLMETPEAEAEPAAAILDSRKTAPVSRTMELLLEVELPVSVSFGKARLPMKDVLKLTTGSIVELDRGINEPVEVLVNHCLIARGEVVVVEGNYGVRIQEIASRKDRLRSLR
jgi:flagellar motor switch protein FliN